MFFLCRIEDKMLVRELNLQQTSPDKSGVQAVTFNGIYVCIGTIHFHTLPCDYPTTLPPSVEYLFALG